MFESRASILRGGIHAEQTASIRSRTTRVLKAKKNEDDGKHTLNLEYDNFYNRGKDSDTLNYSGQIGQFGKCKGDCDSDDDCAGTLVCFQRNGDINNVPGCDGLAHFDVDYCISDTAIFDEQRQEGPTTSPTATTTVDENSEQRKEGMTSSPTKNIAALSPTVDPPQDTYFPSVAPTQASSLQGEDELVFVGHTGPFGRCEGDCDFDEDCAGTMVCYQRDGKINNVPGCTGIATTNVDYCVAKHLALSPSAAPLAVLTESPTAIQTQASTTMPSSSNTRTSQSPSYPTSSPTSSSDTWAPSTPTSTFLPSEASDKVRSNISESNVAFVSKGENLKIELLQSNSIGGLAIMGLAFLSLFVLLVLGLVVRRKRKNSNARKDVYDGTPSTAIVPFAGLTDGPQWGDGSTMNQLTQAFEGENGIEVIDVKAMSVPSIRSAPSSDSFATEPTPLPYDSSLHDKYPKLFGLPEPDPDASGEYDTVEL